MKCLVIKLQEEVNDISLKKIGESVFDGLIFRNDSDVLSLIINARENVQVRVTGNDVYFKVTNNEEHLTSYNIPATDAQNLGGVKIYNPNLSNAFIFIKNKKDVKNLYVATTNTVGFPIEFFSQFPTIERIGHPDEGLLNVNIYGNISHISEINTLRFIRLLGETGVTGNIESLSELTNIESFDFGQCNLYGNINALDKIIKCTYFNFADTKVSGTLESLCQSLFENGLTNDTISMNFQRSLVTYQGELLTSGKSVTFTSSGYNIL